MEFSSFLRVPTTETGLMKMNRFDRIKTSFLVLGLRVCLVGIFSFCPAPAIAAEQTTREKLSGSSEPNAPDVKDTGEQESDIFELKISTYISINRAYSRIFTPELISEEGLLKYSTLNRKRLDVIVAKRNLKKLNPAILMNLSKKEQTAFWINTYNFCTIDTILRYYPIQPKWYMIIYPDNSIMQITGAWTKVFHEIQREEYNLQEIKQDFLLKRCKDPRLCFALSNATVGGATLRNEPYKADHLDEQLDGQVKKYLSTNKGMRWDEEHHTLFLSNVFQMNKISFLDSDLAEIKRFRNRKEIERVWFNFLVSYLPDEDIRHLENTELSVRFIDFDWHLNELQ